MKTQTMTNEHLNDLLSMKRIKGFNFIESGGVLNQLICTDGTVIWLNPSREDVRIDHVELTDGTTIYIKSQ